MKRLVLLALICVGLVAQQDCIKGVPSNIGVSYRGPSGIGYDDGYATAFALLTPNWQRSFQPLLDLRGHFLTNGEWASNAGIGGRFAASPDFIFGMNAFYDFRSARHLRAHQLGAGLEFLHPIFNAWINGYLPVGRTSYVGTVKIDGFVGNTLFATRKVIQDFAHIDGQVGFWFPASWPIDIFLSAGPYYLFSNSTSGFRCGDVWGVKTAFELMLLDGLRAGFSYSYDREFKSNPQGYASFSIPFGPGNVKRGGERWKRWYETDQCRNAARQQRLMVLPIRRDEIVPLCATVQRGPLSSFLGSGVVLPPNCFFVNNSLAASGNGSFETPFNNLSDAQSASGPGDCIYVFFGDGTSNNQNTGITLQSGQILHGSAKDFVIDGVTILPAQSASPPVISNVGGDGVTLADNAQVIGLNIDGATGSGIVSAGASITDAVITCNTIQNSGSFSINVGSGTPAADGTWFVTENNVSGNTDELLLTLNPGSVLTFSNNTISETLGAGDVVSIDPDSAVVLLNRNTFTGSGGGGSSMLNMFMINTVSPSSISVDTNVFDTPSFPFFVLQLSGSGSTIGVNNNSKLPGGGPEFILINTFGSLISASVTNNSGPGSIIINTIFGGASTMCANVVGNTGITGISLSDSAGVSYDASPGSAAAMSAANGGAPVAASASVVFSASLPQPACTP